MLGGIAMTVLMTKIVFATMSDVAPEEERRLSWR